MKQRKTEWEWLKYARRLKLWNKKIQEGEPLTASDEHSKEDAPEWPEWVKDRLA